MNKKFLWRLSAIMMVAMLSVGFTSCGDDDDENGPQNVETTQGGTTNTNIDYGKDGLKGYWYETPTENNRVGCLFYLDGEGGGTHYYGVTTEAQKQNEELYQMYWTKRIGSFKDTSGNTQTFYSSTLYSIDACVYTQKGSTIAITPSQGDTFFVNVVDGSPKSIRGYTRITKVD